MERRRIFADAAAGLDNPSSLHKEGVAAKKELEEARRSVADAIHAHADEIIFTSGGTEANNLAIFGALRKFLREEVEVHAITTAVEHPSVLEPLRALVREGLLLSELGVNNEGQIDIKELRDSITDATVLVSMQMVNSEIGTIQNIKEIAKEVRHARKVRTTALQIFFHTDASQAPLWLPVAVETLGVDMLTLDAQKIFAPRGIGALYVKRGIEIEPVIYGGGQEKGRRSGTENVELAVPFAKKLSEAQKSIEERVRKISHVRDFTLEEIRRLIPSVVLNGPVGESRIANNINISIPNLDGQMAVVAMDAEGVAIATRSACSAEDEELSYVLLALGVSPELAKCTIRITFMPDATKKDAQIIAATLADVANRYSSK